MFAFSLYLLAFIGWASCAPNSPFYWRRNYAMPWLLGPNVCALQEVRGTRDRYFDECMVYRPRSICGLPTFIRYYCCAGYERVKGEKGCVGVRPMENLYGTLKNLRMNQFNEYVEAAKLESTLENQGAFTVFVPLNSAMMKVPTDIKKRLVATPSLINYHIVPGRFNSSQLLNGLLLPTRIDSTGKKTIRINRYSNGIITANCARVVMPNIPSTNGIVHSIDRVITPIDDRPTVSELLIQNNDYREFVTLLINSGLVNDFRDAGPYTVFAPTDEAIAKMPADLRDSIFNNHEALQAWIKYHIIGNHLCSAALIGTCGIRTLEGSKLNITCGPGHQLYIDGSKVTETDLLASNGVIHTIDYPLVPDSSRDLRFMAAKLGLNSFVGLAGSVNLNDTLSRKNGVYYTVFVPSEQAFAAMTAEQLQAIKTNPQILVNMLRYHIIPGRISTQNFVGEQTIRTEIKEGPIVTVSGGSLRGEVSVSVDGGGGASSRVGAGSIDIAGGTDGTILVDVDSGGSKAVGGGTIGVGVSGGISIENGDRGEAAKRGQPPTASISVRISVDRQTYSVNEAKIISSDHSSGNGIVHIIDKVMFPPAFGIYSLVKKDKRLGTLSSFIQTAGLEGMFSVENGNYTLFAPTDQAFNNLESSYRAQLLQDPKKLEKLLRHHVLNKTLFTCSIAPKLKYRHKSNYGENIFVQRDQQDEKHILINGKATVLNADVMGTNGVLYVIDKVLECACPDVQ